MIFFWPPFILVAVHVLVGVWYREKLRKLYNQDVADKNSLAIVNMRANDFDSGLFSCFNGHKGVKKCCFAWWCAPVRWSADASATGLMDFWIALLLSSIFISLMFLFGFVGRTHIRATYEMRRAPVGDFFSWLCCYCCALTQEGKFIDNGFRALRDGRQQVIVESQEAPLAGSAPTPATPDSTALPTSPPISGNVVEVNQT